MVNILVTGGCGFVGRKLAEELSKRKSYKVTVFDRNKKNPIPGVKYITGNIMDPDDVRKAVENQDYVYHLAAILSEDSKMIYDVNLGGTISVLEACRKENIKKLIYISTAGVMEESAEADENTPYGPQTPYEKSKTMAEKTVREFQRRHGLPVTILRPALMYGPNKYWHSILRMAEKAFPIIGPGKNTWHMLYIKNLIPVLVNARTRAKKGEIYVIADEKAYTYEEMHNIILEEMDVQKKPRHVPVWFAKLLALLYKARGKKSVLTLEHINRLIKNKNYDISKAKKELKYKPEYDFRKGIRETIKYFRDEGLLKR